MQKILAIDDDADNLAKLPALLKNLKPECAVSTAASGAEGIERAGAESPDVILLAAGMPEMDGFETCRRLKSHERTKHIPVIMIMASGMDARSRMSGLEAGAEAFLTAPIDPSELISQVKVALRIKQAEDALRRERNSLEQAIRERTASLLLEIAERKKAEAQIQHNEARLRSLVGIFQYRAQSRREFLDNALQEAIQLTESSIGYIYFYHEERHQFVLNTWSKEVMKECAIDKPPTCYELDQTGIWGEAVRQRKPIVINDFQAAHPLKKGYPQGHVALTRFLTVPIFEAQRIIAVVGVANKGSDYDETDVLQLTLLMDAVWKAVDIEEAKEALRESEENHRALVEGLPDIVMRFDRHGRHLFVSDNVSQMVDLQATQFIGRTHRELGFPEAQCRFWEQAIGAVFDSGVPSETEFSFDGKQGPVICNWRLVPERDAGGMVRSVLSISRDITAHRRAEQSYRTLFNEMLNGFALHEIVCDAAGDPVDYRFLAVNPAFERLTGLTAQAIVGRTALEALPGTERHWIETYGKVALTGEPVFFENYSAAMDKHFEVTAFRPAAGQFVCIFADITERKRAEQEQAKLQAQLQQAQKMESVGRLAGGVAHDFNNMLNVILGHTEMALETVDPAQPLFGDLTEIRKAAHRSADLTRQLLAFARKQIVVPKVLDLNETVEGMLRMLRRLIGEDIELAWLPGLATWPVKVDPSQIDQILANLCVNARAAIVGGGKVTIETGNAALDEAYCAAHPGLVPGEYACLSVSDDGRGMDPETLAHIFEPFFTTKEVGEGTGLGLATVYGAVQQNKGFIDVRSAPGQGSIFSVYLPRHVGEAGRALTEGAAEEAVGGQETILLVEDEPILLKLIQIMLERQGYTVLAMNSPSEAGRLAAEYADPIHLLMTDVVMPGMNGRELWQQIGGLRPETKCLFMSGYTANVIADHGVLDPGVHFIQKPFMRKQLAAKVREALEQKI